MEVLNVCENYFNAFQEVSNFRKNDSKKNVLTALKFLSYFTIVIPLGFAIAYGAASLYGRISKKQELSSHDKSVSDKAKTVLLRTDPSTKGISPTVEPSNRQLAEKIIAAKGKDDEYVQTICSGDFLVDPTARLIREMIERGAGRARMDDIARSFIIGQIPDFIEKVSSTNYLRSFAERFFENYSNKTEVIEIFEKSLSNEEFQRDLASAVKRFKEVQSEDSFYYAECSLRIPLTIYHQSAQLKEYSYPEEANLQ